MLSRVLNLMGVTLICTPSERAACGRRSLPSPIGYAWRACVKAAELALYAYGMGGSIRAAEAQLRKAQSLFDALTPEQVVDPRIYDTCETALIMATNGLNRARKGVRPAISPASSSEAPKARAEAPKRRAGASSQTVRKAHVQGTDESTIRRSRSGTGQT